MAHSYYYKTISGDALKLWKDFTWSSTKSKAAAKAALSCVLSVLIALSFDFSSAYWSGLTCGVLAQVTVGSIVKKGLMRGVGTILGALLAVIVYGAFIQSYYLFSAFLFFFTAYCFYRRFMAVRYEYFWYLMMATFIIISVAGYESGSPMGIYHLAVYRAVEILIGVIVTVFVNIYVFPDYASDDLSRKFESLERGVIELHKDILLMYVSKSAPQNNIDEKHASLSVLTKNFDELLNNASFEKLIPQKRLEKISSASIALGACADNIVSFYEDFRKDQNYYFQRHFSGLFKAMLGKLDELVMAIGNKNKRLAGRVRKELDNLVNQSENKYRALTGSGRSRTYPVSDVLALNEALYLFKSLYAVFSGQDNKESARSPSTTHNKGFYGFREVEFFGSKFEIYMPALQFGIKAGLAILVVIWLWWALELPGGQGGVNIGIAVLTVFQPDNISSNLKAILRLSGCLAGAMLGMLFLALQIDSVTIMAICLFVVVYFAAYVYIGGGPGVSYIGLQAIFAYIITILPDTGPAQDISGIVFRIVGIILGIVVIWAMNRLFWDTPPREQLTCHYDSYIEYFARLRISEYDNDTVLKLDKDIGIVGAVLSRIKGQGDISGQDYTEYSAWISIHRKLIYTLKSMHRVEPSTWLFFKNILPLCDEFASNLNNPDYNREKSVRRINSAIENLKQEIRIYRLMKDMTVAEKQEICHVIFSLKTLLRLFASSQELGD